MIDFNALWSQLTEIDLTPILLSLALGGLVGLEREMHGRPAGTRTHMLVCLCATVLMIASREVPQLTGQNATVVFDPQRLAAGIVTGVGFLGAAVVVRSGDIVRGLTTAACVWCVAGVGVVIGSGAYGLAVVATFGYLFVLVVVNWLPGSLAVVIYRRLRVRGTNTDIEDLVERVRAILRLHNMRVQELSGGIENGGDTYEVVFHVRCRTAMAAPQVLRGVARIEGVATADWKSVLR